MSTMLRLVREDQDIARATEIIAAAFAKDPLWAPVLSPNGDLDVALKYWRFLVASAARRYPYTFISSRSDGLARQDLATAVWLPPGGTEFDPQEEAEFEGFARQLLGDAKTAELMVTFERFEAAHPHAEPAAEKAVAEQAAAPAAPEHYYLSLLATNPAHAGEGHGMALLRENLKQFDSLGVATYLESSNPDNDRRYEAMGYKRYGQIELPSGLTISTFWRDPEGQR